MNNDMSCTICGDTGVQVVNGFVGACGHSLESYFDRLRKDPAHHLGLGDIRLTLAQQEELSKAPSPEADLVACARVFHDAYCPSCPDHPCGLGDALAEHARRAVTKASA